MSHENASKRFRQLCEFRKQGIDCREFLRDSAVAATEPIDRHDALSLLAAECRSHDDLNGAEIALRECAAMFPDDPASHIALAQLLQEKGDAQEALEYANAAVSSAMNLSKVFVYAHHSRIEIAIMLQRKDVAEESLRAILDYNGKLESWHLDKCTTQALRQLGVDPTLVERYQTIVAPLADDCCGIN